MIEMKLMSSLANLFGPPPQRLADKPHYLGIVCNLKTEKLEILCHSDDWHMTIEMLHDMNSDGFPFMFIDLFSGEGQSSLEKSRQIAEFSFRVFKTKDKWPEFSELLNNAIDNIRRVRSEQTGHELPSNLKGSYDA